MWYTKTSNLDPAVVRQAHLWDQFLSKYYEDCPEDNERLKAAALVKFMDAEHRCLTVNRHGRYYSEFTEFTNEPVIFRARQLIASVLGSVDLECIFKPRMHTPGATTSRTRREAHPVRKLLPVSRRPHVTKRALAYAHAYVNASPGLTTHFNKAWGESWFRLRESSVLSFVPKNNREHRIICSEPDMNILLQRCVGKYICKRIRKYGVDLSDQTRNQVLALIGSITGRLATVDLSAASDSIALVAVQDLLPPEWFQLLTDLRCDYVKLPCGSFHRLEKISSMGNGFTFELESLIFWALTVASCEAAGHKDALIAVYGDDIILPTECVGVLHGVLTSLGFLFNTDKSFVDGFFRESCGKHYYKGADVTPYYVKRMVDRGDLFLWANNHLEWNGGVIDPLYKGLVRSIPFADRCSVPENSEAKRAGFRHPYGCHREPVRVKGGRLLRTFRQWVPVKRDITGRFSEQSRYYSWFLTRTPPETLVFDPYRGSNRTSVRAPIQMSTQILSEPSRLEIELDYRVKKKQVEVRSWESREAV